MGPLKGSDASSCLPYPTPPLPLLLVPTRTFIDLLLSVVLILSSIPGAEFKRQLPEQNEVGCKILGAVNQFVFVAGLAWYGVMAFDLHLAIRNPFRCSRV